MQRIFIQNLLLLTAPDFGIVFLSCSNTVEAFVMAVNSVITDILVSLVNAHIE